MEIQVTVENQADIAKMVLSLPPELFATIQQVLENGQVRLAERAQENAPVKTGFLRASIQYTRDGPGEVDAAFRPLKVEAQADYSSFVEFGTSKMEAQPFLGPAADEVFPQILAEVDTAFNSVVERKNRGI